MTSISEEYVPGLLSSSLTDDKAKKYAPKIVKVDNETLQAELAKKKKKSKNMKAGPSKGKMQITREQKKEKDARTVFVGNVPVDVKPKEIVKFFKKYGLVESTRVRSVAVVGTKVSEANNYKLFRKASIIQGKVNRDVKDTCNAYVVFKEKSSVEKALEDNNCIFHGNHIRIDSVAQANSGIASTKKSVFVGNIPFDASEESLRQVFALGTSGGNDGIVNVRIVRDRSKNLGKGFGYVQFSDRSYAKEALALNGTFLDNRQLRIVKVSTKSQLEEKKLRKLEKKQSRKNGANSNGDKKGKKLRTRGKKDSDRDGAHRSNLAGSSATKSFQGERAKFGAYLRIKRKRKDKNKPRSNKKKKN